MAAYEAGGSHASDADVVALALTGASPAAAQDIRQKQIQLAVDHPIRLRGAFHGSEMVDYRFDGAEGARLSIAMHTDNPSAHFDLHGPVGGPSRPDESAFIGPASGLEFTGRIPQAGVYVIRVSLFRDAARRNEEAYYRLDIRWGGNAGAAPPSEGDVAGDGTDQWQVVGFKAESALNIRSAPSARGVVVARARNGDVLNKGGCLVTDQTSWCRVTTQDGIEGWAARHLLGE